MRSDYDLHEVRFVPTNYRDKTEFKHPLVGYKSKRWEVSTKFIDPSYEEGVSHPDDQFIDGADTTFTEWRMDYEDFNPMEFLTRLINLFETFANINKRTKGYNDALVLFVNFHGNNPNEYVFDRTVFQYIEEFIQAYRLPTFHSCLPFENHLELYQKQLYLFYSNCKLIKYLIDPKSHIQIFGSLEHLRKNNFTVIINN
jgi:hypothetical protein